MTGSLIVFVHEGKTQRKNKHSHLGEQCAELAICLKMKKKNGRKQVIINCIKENDENDVGIDGSERLQKRSCSKTCQGLETIHT